MSQAAPGRGWGVAGACLVLWGSLWACAAQAQLGWPGESTPAGVKGSAGPLVQHDIVTTTRYLDGVVETREGTGFVVGRRFVTVYHNIASQAGRERRERRIEVQGVLVRPLIVDTLNDIAIFELPAALCSERCDDRPDYALTAPLPGQSIAWFPETQASPQQADVVEVIYRHYAADAATTACDSGVVVAVDAPFLPGSSGGPVIDASSGALLGMVQGSFLRGSGAQVGYYVPMHCVLSLLTGRVVPLGLPSLHSDQ